VLTFDFLDAPDPEAMADALRQLYVVGAIDVDGHVTPLGREMSPMPVEPQLARALIEARELGCVDEMATVGPNHKLNTIYP
jgi:ATP-dependent RNA helicase DHX8/PRP22